MISFDVGPIGRSGVGSGSPMGWVVLPRWLLPGLAVVGLGVLPEAAGAVPSAAVDSVEARIAVEQERNQLQIRGQFVNRGGPEGTLRYELVVRRRGSGGTGRITQSGQVETAPGRVDTLSAVQVNVRAGDRLECRLDVWADGRVVAEARRAWTVAPANETGAGRNR